jgi:hypothetical protein
LFSAGIPDEDAVPYQLNAKASKLEHSSTRPAAVSARKPSDTKSWLRMVHLSLSMLVRIY